MEHILVKNKPEAGPNFTSMDHAVEPRALIFDLMGTCCNWKKSILLALESCSPKVFSSDQLSQLAADWRSGFFSEIHHRFRAGSPAEDVDITNRRVLDALLDDRKIGLDIWDNTLRNTLVNQWHIQQAWPDAVAGLRRLKEKFFVVVLANGTTRLQLDIIKSSSLSFDMLFSSELLGATKPDPSAYLRVLELLKLRPEQCLMVAAHAYDLQAAKKVGLKVVYIQRSTEDLNEDMNIVRNDVDLFIGREANGLGVLADILNV